MDNKQLLEHFEEINLFLESVGIDEKTKENHFNRLSKVTLASAAEKIDNATSLKEKAPFPDMKSLEDFYTYFEQYIDRETIDKVVKEEAQRVFKGYFDSLAGELPQ